MLQKCFIYITIFRILLKQILISKIKFNKLMSTLKRNVYSKKLINLKIIIF